MKTKLVKIISITMIMVVMLGTASSAYGSYPSFTIDVSDRIDEMLDNEFTYGYIVMLTKLDGTIATDTAPYAILTSDKRLDVRVDQVYNGTTLYDIITTNNNTQFRRKTFSDANPVSNSDSPKYTNYGPYSNGYEIYNGALTNRNPIIVWTNDENITIDPDIAWNKIERLSLLGPANGSILSTTSSGIVWTSYAPKVGITITDINTGKYVNDYIFPVNQFTHSVSIKVSDIPYINNHDYRFLVQNLNEDSIPIMTDDPVTNWFSIKLSALNMINISGLEQGKEYYSAPTITVTKGGSYYTSKLEFYLNNSMYKVIQPAQSTETFSLYDYGLDLLQLGKNTLVVKADGVTYKTIDFIMMQEGSYQAEEPAVPKPIRPKASDGPWYENLGDWMAYVLDSITYVFRVLIRSFKVVLQSSEGLVNFYRVYMSFIPEEVIQLMVLGTAIFIVLKIFKR